MRPSNHDGFNKPHDYSHKEGYVEKEYAHQEFPKLVSSRDEEGERVSREVANEAEEQQFFKEYPAEEEESAEPEAAEAKPAE